MQTSEEMIKFRNYIESCLLKEGFKPEHDNWNFSYNEYTIGDEKQVILDGRFHVICGYTLRLTEVHRRNGTAENVSFRFDIMEWDRNSGNGIESVKISYKDSKKKQDKLITYIIEKYKDLIGGSAISSNNDLRQKLYEMCDRTNTKRSGIDYLVNYYIESLHWSEDEACEYALGLFKNGTIHNIRLFGKDGEEL